MAALAVALTANAVSVTNVFPYSPYLPKFLGLTDDDRELGFYAGFFMTAYMVGSGMSALFWGIVMKVAWPTELEEWAEGGADSSEGGSK